VLPLKENRVDPYDLVLTKQLRNEIDAYTREGRTAPVHVQLAALRVKRAGGPGKGGAPRPGDRLPFIIRAGDPKEPLSMRGEDPTYAFEHGVPIDADYYLSRHVGPALQRIFEPLVTAHRVDLETDAQRAAATHEFLFNSKTDYCAPTYAYEYDFSEYRDKSAFSDTVVRYTNRRRLDASSSLFMRSIKSGAECVGCGLFLEGRRTGAVCTECFDRNPGHYMESLVASLAQLRVDENDLTKERAAIVAKCEECTGCKKQFTHIVCEEWDCAVMWRRQANMQALRECEARTNDVVQSLSHDW